MDSFEGMSLFGGIYPWGDFTKEEHDADVVFITLDEVEEEDAPPYLSMGLTIDPEDEEVPPLQVYTIIDKALAVQLRDQLNAFIKKLEV